MALLSVNIDFIAVIREQRKTNEPDPVTAAGIAELAGAHGITVHLREDRRHIQDRDLRLLREVVRTPLNLEMAVADEIVKIALNIKPEQATIVPEKRQEVTTEGGLDVITNREQLFSSVERMKDHGIKVSLFIDPEEAQIKASRDVGADAVELHTGEYALGKTTTKRRHELDRIVHGADFARKMGLEVHAGHGLTYVNVVPVASIDGITELYIGHSIMARAVLVGLEKAVRDMIALIYRGPEDHVHL